MPYYPLVIDNQARALISVAIAEAHRNHTNHHALNELIENPPVESPRRFTVEIPMSYVATFTIEERVPGHLFRHLAVSILNGKTEQTPHPSVIDDIMQEFRFINPRADAEGWLESLPDGRCAVNLIEPLDGNWTPFLAPATKPVS